MRFANMAGVRPAPSRHSHEIDRRTLFRVASGAAAGVVLGPALLEKSPARAAGYDDPKPIPGGFAGPHGPHVFLVGRPPGNEDLIYEPSSITDFNGLVGITQVQGFGVGTDKQTGQTIPMAFDTDMRFMKGAYIAEDGVRRNGTFGFI